MADDGTNSSSFLICSSAARLWAIPVEHVAETMRALPLEALGEMPSFVLGIAVVRGAAVPVVLLARVAGAPEAAPAGRYITLKLGAGRLVALAAEGVIGVRQLALDAIDEIPPLLHESQPEVVAAITRLDTQLLSVLQVSRLVPDAVWRGIEVAQARP
jgi:purine-binding chemotaxis protein CheW